ncbi:MAG TPA: transporter substrate-binding domain-containing protein [Nitrospinota bacterium]|nr:transporter substrate-binding domain-containing protein [Nitrospinota bacterium]
MRKDFNKLFLFLATISSLFFSGAYFVGPAFSDDRVKLTELERKWLADHPDIRLAPDPFYPPVEFIDKSGKFKGISADYVDLLGKKLGIQFQVMSFQNWDEVMTKTKKKEVDMLSAATKSPQRSEFMAFTKPYIELPGVIIVRSKVEGKFNMEKLQGMKVAVVSSYIWHELIKTDYPNVKIDPVPDMETGLKKVSFGMADAMVANLGTASYYLEEAGITNLRVAGESGYYAKLAMATRKDWPQLNSILQKALDSIGPDERQSIFNKWIHLQQSQWQPSKKFIITSSVIFALLFLGGIVLWNLMLKRKVKQRTRELNFQKFALDEHAIVSATDLKGNITYANDKFCKISGYSRDEVMGKNHRIIKSDEHPPEFFRDMWHTISNSKVWHGEVKNKKKDGGHYWVQSSIVPFMDETGKPHQYISIRTDITERKQIEEALIEAKEQAEDATKLKDKFVGIVAHDLRSPFASITGLLNLVMEDKTQSLNPKHKMLIEKVLVSGSNLNHLIDQLLNINRLQTGRIKLKRKFMDARMLVDSHVESLSYLVEKKGVKLENQVALHTRIYVDFDLFGEVIQNLLTNSIKFCEKGDTIKVFSEIKNGTKGIAVSDTGVGIPDWLTKNIFNHDEKTSTTGTGGEKGTGLGLPFSYDIMKAHGGSLTFESVKGNGATFYAKLPIVRPTILLVDDDLSIRKLLVKKLGPVDADILEAESGEKALKFIEKAEPHLILLDIVMPGMDGFEVLDRIRNRLELKSIPVIVITSDNNTETRNMAFQLGANDFITKPIRKEDLIPRVRKFM